MKILVTGGAGYIGSHMVRKLIKEKHDVVVIDSMERGHRESLPTDIKLVAGNVGNHDDLVKAFSLIEIDAVIHFAGYISMEESVRDPRLYMINNLIKPIELLEVMAQFNVKNIIFSSTAGVYGNPTQVPIPETHLKNPLNPYGLSKWSFEELLTVYGYHRAIKSISLRYFNAAGAEPDGSNGEDHGPESHIIPIAIRTAQGKLPQFSLFGVNYPTRDGSCERDYIHVEDLATAHIKAIEALANGHQSDVYNVGTGNGITNKEIIKEVKAITGLDFKVTEAPDRPGDAAVLVADSTKLRKEFGWEPQYSDIRTIISSAWKWHQSHPDGYTKGRD